MKNNKFIKPLSVLLMICLLGLALAMPVFSAGDFMYGNVDNNSKVDVADTIQLLRYIVGLGTLDGDKWYAADVHGEGQVNVADANLILRKVVGLVDLFPAEEKLNHHLLKQVGWICC